MSVTTENGSAAFVRNAGAAPSTPLEPSRLTTVSLDDKYTATSGAIFLSGIQALVRGNAQLLQSQADSALFEAMKHKEEMMVALGAKIIEVGASGNMTATQANNEQAEETSVLSTIAHNISDAYTKALKCCARYMGFKEDDLVLTLNTDFGFSKMTPEQRVQLMAEWQGGAITWAEYREKMVESEIAIEENAESALQTIREEQGAMIYAGDNEV